MIEHFLTFYSITSCSILTLYFPYPSHEINHFSKEFLFVGECYLETKICARCYLSDTALGPLRCQSKEIYVLITHAHVFICISFNKTF